MGLSKNLAQHEDVDEDLAVLEQVQAEHAELLVLATISAAFVECCDAKSKAAYRTRVRVSAFATCGHASSAHRRGVSSSGSPPRIVTDIANASRLVPSR
jgi:hypothetical protein